MQYLSYKMYGPVWNMIKVSKLNKTVLATVTIAFTCSVLYVS